MSGFAVVIALAIAADILAGISNPSRSFAVLPVLITAVVLWAALVWRKELRPTFRRQSR
jgi:predicted anti-sigma-YlaC factor YlaD